MAFELITFLMNKIFEQLRVAIVADWLTNYGGAESVIESFTRIFPNSDLFTTVFVPEEMKSLGGKKVKTSPLQILPRFIRKRHQSLLMFLPRAIESFDLSGYDLVLSSSSFVGKGCLTTPESLHICYCHTPTRYLWDSWQEYVKEFPFPRGFRWLRKLLPSRLSKLRIWDRFAAERPDVYIANSEFIAERIRKYYRKKSAVITPPVDFEKFSRGTREKKGDYYFSMGRLTPYKRFDLLVETFFRLPSKRLLIAGKGPHEKHLREMARDHPNIEILGYVSDDELVRLLGEAKGFLFPQIEDAGISLMEGMAAGTPVIALKKGGAMDIVREGENGVFFDVQSVRHVEKAIDHFESLTFDRKKVQDSVKEYSREKFEERIEAFCREKWEEFRSKK